MAEQVREIGTLERAWHVIYRNGRSSTSRETRQQADEFASDAAARLNKIQRQLRRHAFKFRPAKGIAIPKQSGKGVRPIVIAPIESRIVQRAIHDVLLTLPSIREYAEDPYSFGGVRKARGEALAAVPAAIEAVAGAIQSGARYVIRSDISSFFAKIPKPTVTEIVARATEDPVFMGLFAEAITVELENLAALKELRTEFPIYEVGVAQGNSLSPLLGNILLHDFDYQMNAGNCKCIRYVDDFIILAPDQTAAQRQFDCGLKLLQQHGLSVNQKTTQGDIKRPFTFLGIDFSNGAIRPSRESRKHLLARVSETLNEGARAFYSCRASGKIDRSASLIRMLYEVSGIIAGWGKHYSFCNEKNIFAQLDVEVDSLLRKYLSSYSQTRKKLDRKGCRRIIGIPLLEDLVSRPIELKQATQRTATARRLSMSSKDRSK